MAPVYITEVDDGGGPPGSQNVAVCCRREVAHITKRRRLAVGCDLVGGQPGGIVIISTSGLPCVTGLLQVQPMQLASGLSRFNLHSIPPSPSRT
jgi:hypothetical protein